MDNVFPVRFMPLNCMTSTTGVPNLPLAPEHGPQTKTELFLFLCQQQVGNNMNPHPVGLRILGGEPTQKDGLFCLIDLLYSKWTDL